MDTTDPDNPDPDNPDPGNPDPGNPDSGNPDPLEAGMVPVTRRVRWTHALGISVLAFCVWLVLDAPTLQHNAQVSPVGVRRTVALDLLGPVADLSRDLQFSHVVSVGNGVIGRHGNRPGNGSVVVSVGPKKPPVTTTSHPSGSTPTTAVAAPTTTTLPATVDPTASNPLRVLVIGDSLGIDLGGTLVNDLGNTGVVQATLDGQVGTGLTRPDYYNWPVELQSDLPKYTPQVVVVMVGANDPQDLPGPPDVPYGSAAWTATYSGRVVSFMTEAAGAGAKVIWVGMPPMSNGTLSSQMQNLNGIYQAAAAQTGATYLSSWTVLGTPQGQYAAYLVYNGQEVNVREPDGTHIAPGGAEILSQVVLATMRDQLHIPVPPG